MTRTRTALALLTALMVSAAGHQASAAGAAGDDDRSALTVQGGWWSLEGEWRTAGGLTAAVGIPWMGAVLSGPGSSVPFGARLGYEYDASARWKLRGNARVAGVHARSSCLCRTWEANVFGMLEVGLRYRGDSGFVAGLDMPLLVFDEAHDIVRGRAEGVELFPFPISAAFSQLYAGYSWLF